MAIVAYHASRFPARTEFGNPLDFSKGFPLVGIEYETEINARHEAIAAVERAVEKDDVKFFAEQDGTLHPATGVEFVSTPMSVLEAMQVGGPVDKLITTLRPFGFNIVSRAVGLHVNVSASSYDHAWATACLGNALGDYSRSVGGRTDVYSKHEDVVKENYNKKSAVCVKARNTNKGLWVSPSGEFGLPLDAPDGTGVEYRNEFRNHASLTCPKLTRIQILYSLLVSAFASGRVKELIKIRQEVINGATYTMTEEHPLCVEFVNQLTKLADEDDMIARVVEAMTVGIHNLGDL